jgi:hypothetical protein
MGNYITPEDAGSTPAFATCEVECGRSSGHRYFPNFLVGSLLKSGMLGRLHRSPVRFRPLRKQGCPVVGRLSILPNHLSRFYSPSLNACGTTGERDCHPANGFNSHIGRKIENVSRKLVSTLSANAGKTTLASIGRRFESGPAQAGSSARIEQWKLSFRILVADSLSTVTSFKQTGECR